MDNYKPIEVKTFQVTVLEEDIVMEKDMLFGFLRGLRYNHKKTESNIVQRLEDYLNNTNPIPVKISNAPRFRLRTDKYRADTGYCFDVFVEEVENEY